MNVVNIRFECRGDPSVPFHWRPAWNSVVTHSQSVLTAKSQRSGERRTVGSLSLFASSSLDCANGWLIEVNESPFVPSFLPSPFIQRPRLRCAAVHLPFIMTIPHLANLFECGKLHKGFWAFLLVVRRPEMRNDEGKDRLTRTVRKYDWKRCVVGTSQHSTQADKKKSELCVMFDVGLRKLAPRHTAAASRVVEGGFESSCHP